MVEKHEKKNKIFLVLDVVLGFVLIGILLLGGLRIFPDRSKTILIIVAFAATASVVASAVRSLIQKKITVDLLASIALAVSLIEREWVSVIFINLMIASARVFSYYVAIKSNAALEALLKLKPQRARVERGGKVAEIPVEAIRKDDQIIVGLGERVPVDGFVEKGEASIDESNLTGESIPVSKKAGDKVFGSTIIASGNLMIRAEKIGEETTFSKVVKLVAESHKHKAPISVLSDKFGVWYIAVTLFGSFILYAISQNIGLVLSVLLVSCADDIAVAIPLAFLSSINHGARHGVIVKGGDFLEALTKLKVVVMDKTGTLTRGKLKVEEVFAFNSRTPKEIFELAGIVSLVSVHPSARAIIKHAKEKNIPVREPENFKEYSGKGAIAFHRGRKIISGKVSFFEELKIKINTHQLRDINGEKEQGLSTTLIGLDGELVGFITLADEVRSRVKETISRLKQLGVEKIVMLTGDNEKIAKRIANHVGIDEFHANLSPEGKLKFLKKHLGKKYKTAMIGDGVNDAPALACADIGIAMGVIGSDVAIESADIALMKDDLFQIPELIKISKATLRNVHQNLWMWGIVNAVGLILVFGQFIGPQGAATYNFLTDFIPIFNALRLFR